MISTTPTMAADASTSRRMVVTMTSTTIVATVVIPTTMTCFHAHLTDHRDLAPTNVALAEGW